MVHLAKCCSPVPGDAIIGYITKGRGVSVHRADCPNAEQLSDPDRRIEVEWETGDVSAFPVSMEITAYDRTGLMADILSILAGMKLSVSAAHVQVKDSGMAVIVLEIRIKDLPQLEFIMTKIRRVKGIHSVRRI